MTAAEFRDELVNLGTCFCPDGQVPYILNSGRHAPDCHADERWVEDFDAMLASVVADAEARGRQQALDAFTIALRPFIDHNAKMLRMVFGGGAYIERPEFNTLIDLIDHDATARGIVALSTEATDGR